MQPHTRKLLLLYDNEPGFATSIESRPPPDLPLPKPIVDPALHNASSPQSRKPPQTAPLFDSSMVLTVLVLLTALFFMGFFSIYIRRFSEDQTAQVSRRRRHRIPPYRNSSQSRGNRMPAPGKGLDQSSIQSLPVRAYHGDAKYQVDCPICLSEFEDRESVKVIPHCRHVFHVECIDTWLTTHVTCPVCRGTQLFEIKRGGGGGGPAGSVKHEEEVDHSSTQLGGGSTAESDETCVEVGTLSLRRLRSGSSLGERELGGGARGLHRRTSSF